MELADFKRAYQGERLFLLGNGPSLNDTPLEKLSGEYTFAMNNIAAIYPKTPWRPSFYFNITWQVDRHPLWKELALTSIALGMPSFVRSSSPLPDTPNLMRVRVESRLTPTGHKLCRTPQWSHDSEECVVTYRMSAYSLVQLAIWMGFGTIYMLGMDLSFSMNPSECHFADKYEGTFEWTPELVAHENYWHRVAHEWVRYYANLCEVPVYNATAGGSLEVYPRVDLLDVI